jgi:RimJ/RimL family protein N-acetyltransferase
MDVALTLVTERLTLRPVEASDLQDLVDLWADPAFATSIFPTALSAEEVWFRLLRDIGHWGILGFGNWSIRETKTGDYVGSVGVFDYRRQLDPAFDAPELGWGVAPRFQGKGIALEAVSAALRWCDETLRAPRTVCMISPENSRSLTLAGRAGFSVYTTTSYKGAAVHLLERCRP